MLRIKSYFLILLPLSFLLAQENPSPIATAGSDKISVDELMNRFEFMPHSKFSDDNKDTLKKEFLYSIIAEKLWALEALEQRYDTLDIVEYPVKTLEKMFVRDELYKREIESKAILTNKELAEGIYRVTNLLKVNFILTKDSAEAFDIHEFLKTTNSFDSLLHTRSEYQIQKEPIDITLGKMQEKSVEDILYNMKQGEITKPIKSKNEWYIFKLMEITSNPAIASSSEKAKDNAEKMMHDITAQRLADDYIYKILGNKNYSADKELFNIFSDSLIAVIKENFNHTESDTSFSYQLDQADILQTLRNINEADLKKTFVSLDGNLLTLKDFLYFLIYKNITFLSPGTSDIKNIFNAEVKQFIQNETLAKEGFERGFNNLPMVKNDIKIWRDHYLSNNFIKEIIKESLKNDDEQIKNFINKKTVQLANKYGISINWNLLDNLKLSPLNTFTYRLIGFGNRIAAFPITTPMFEWYKLWQEKKELP